MADRVSVAIRIGGSLPPALLPAFCEAIESDGACFDWEGTAFDADDLQLDQPFYLVALEVVWGRFEAIEAFCVEHSLIFARWAGGASGSFGPERVVHDGTIVRNFTASDDDEILISASSVRDLGSHEAVLAHFAAAELQIPPFRLDSGD